MEKFNIGQVLTLKEDKELEGVFGTKKPIKMGEKAYVMADSECPTIHYSSGCIQKLDDAEIDGYSVDGLSDWIYTYLLRNSDLKYMLEDYETSEKEFKNLIGDALEELGFYDNSGNRS